MQTYKEFIEGKNTKKHYTGIDVKDLNPMLYDYEHDIVKWSLKKGRAAIWADCGLGKTPMQLEWAWKIYLETHGKILIIAPLAVSCQTIQEGIKFGRHVKKAENMNDCVENGLYITNYEKACNPQRFDLSIFDAIVLDESSILKNYSGKMRNYIINECKTVKYKLACTATPSPNDFEEIGNHAEFLGICTRKEMLSMFFIHDSNDTAKWRLKGHGQNKFWEWLSSWAVMIRKPSDLGYSDEGFILPKLQTFEHIVKQAIPNEGELFVIEAKTLTDRRRSRKATIEERCQLAYELIHNHKENENPVSWLVWCNLNDESKLLHNLIPNSVEVTGSMSSEQKTKKIMQFTSGEIPILISKPPICGFGMNWQHCHNVVFVGLSDSYEQLYQAVRRVWRHKQEHDVNMHIIIAETEGAVLKNIHRKERNANMMFNEMVKNMCEISQQEIHGEKKMETHQEYSQPIFTEDYELYHGDCVEKIQRISNNSIDYSIFSPPFAELYTYSDSDNDMGNSKNYDEFFEHFRFLVEELQRVMMPGRLVSFHCVDIPAMKERDGYIGLKDFPADLIDVFEEFGFIYHSKHIIWKDPLIEATRTKALGLMHKQLCKDSSMCRAGLPDYLITMRMPGKNKKPIKHPDGLTHYAGSGNIDAQGVKRSHQIWRKYASPVWMDIRQTNTLNRNPARESKDEKHICPLQLDVVERGLTLYSNPGDTILSPFGGIGTEIYQAIKMERRGIACELKKSYFDVMAINCKLAKQETLSLF